MNPLEVAGFLTGGICVFLQVREKIWNWPVGIANNVLYMFMFWQNKLYADACLQLFFMAIAVYGWWKWLYGGAGHSHLQVQRTTARFAWALLAITVVAGAIIYAVLRRFSDSDVPWGDATTTAVSLTAQYMLGRKFIENWFLWIGVNVLYLGLYCYKRLFLTALLNVIFTVLCVMGYRSWRASLESPSTAAATA